MKAKPVLAIAVCILALCASALADTIHVSPSGGTIQAAIDSASTGDTVLVFPGTYMETINFRGKPITVRSSDGPLHTTITYDQFSTLVVFSHGERHDAVIEGFTLSGGWMAVRCEDSAPTIRRNIIVGQQAFHGAAITLMPPVDIIAPDVEPPDTDTIYCHSDAVIVNNTIMGNASGILTFSNEPPVIKNNIIVYNMAYGIMRYDIVPGAVEPDLSYNDVYQNDPPHNRNYVNITNPGIGSISVNPMLTRSYTLQPGSPCIEAGDPDPRYNDPDGTRNDMGAIPFEHPPIPRDVWHISVNGNDITGDGSPENPFRTITHGIRMSTYGDTVLVHPGVYYELVNFMGKAITVRSSDGPLATTITSAQRDDSERSIFYALVTFDHGESRQAVLEGFTLRNGWIGIKCINAAPTIRRNILVGQGVTDWAAICLGGPGYPEWVTTGWAPAVIENNTIIFCENGGISTFSTAPPVIKNNIIAFNKHYGIHREGIQPGVAQPALSYNDVYASRVLYYEIPHPGIGSISANPLFDRSYRLTAGSPCIDAGDPDPRYNDPDGTRNDMGAVPSPFGGGPVPTNEWISVYCEAPWVGGNPVPAGTVIRAFDPDGVLCGMDVVRNTGSYGFMPIYRDDIYTDFDEGADPGDAISFTLDGMPSPTHPEIVWTVHGDIFELCDFSGERCLEISLHEGWNLISWNLEVYGEIGDIISEIEECIDVVLGFELDGVAYDPALPDFSTLRELGYHYGYWFRMRCAATLRVCGPEIPTERSAASISVGNGIHVYAGWNLISYWPREPYPVEEAFTHVLDILDGASGFDRGAQVWRPDMPRLNTLTELRPGFGYWVKVSNDAILYYPGFAPRDTIDLDAGAGCLAGRDGAPSRNWMLVYGRGITLDGRELSPRDVIEFRTETGARCGNGVYADGKLKFTPVYGYDSMAESALRMPRVSERISILVNGTRVYPSISWDGNGRRIRIQNLFSDEAVEIPASHHLSQNFPNPFNPGTTISFDLPAPGEVRLSIFTVSGRLVRTLVQEHYPAGRHAVSWNGRNEEGQLVATGVYLYRLETSGFVKTKKMVIMR